MAQVKPTSPVKYRLWRIFYHLLLVIFLPFALMQLKSKAVKDATYKGRWKERFGRLPFALDTRSIHLHAASLGEVTAVIPLINKLLQAYPETPIVVTTATPTGSAKVTDTFGDSVYHCYLPFDLGWSIEAFLRAANPKISLIMEVELWPNFINQCHLQKIPTVVVNARMTDKSTKGYKKLGDFFQLMCRQLTLVLGQSERDIRNYQSLGVSESQLLLAGNIKFDLSIPPEVREQGQQLKQSWHNRPVLVAGSSHEKDEAELIPAFKTLLETHPELLLILVPRHPHRFNTVFEQLKQANLAVARRSSDEPVVASTQVLLGDTMGELNLWYSCADFAFVGGSIQPHGGHNPLEPAYFSIPVIMGPHVENCKQVVAQLIQSQGLKTVTSADDIAETIRRWLDAPSLAKQQGTNAYQVVAGNKGALEKTLIAISRTLDSAS